MYKSLTRRKITFPLTRTCALQYECVAPRAELQGIPGAFLPMRVHNDYLCDTNIINHNEFDWNNIHILANESSYVKGTMSEMIHIQKQIVFE